VGGWSIRASRSKLVPVSPDLSWAWGASCAGSPQARSTAAGSSFDAAQLRADIRFLASDLLEGRRAGTRGYDIAAEYVAARLASLGIAPGAEGGYFQPVRLREVTPDLDATSVELSDPALAAAVRVPDSALVSAALGHLDLDLSGAMTYVGKGVCDPDSGRDDAAGADLAGRFLLGGFAADQRFRMLFQIIRQRAERSGGTVHFLQRAPGPLVIGSIGDDKLDLVRGFELGQVLPSVPVGHSAPRALQIHDDPDPRVDGTDIQTPPRFDHDLMIPFQECLHQIVDTVLAKRLPARDEDQATSEGPYPIHDRLDGHLLAALESVRRVAPDAPQIASSQANEGAAPSGLGRLTLDAVEDFRDPDSGLAAGHQTKLLSRARFIRSSA